MSDIIFPKGLPTGCNVVIYGADLTGWCFYEQIRSLKHCSVIAFADRTLKKNPWNVPVYNPEWLAANKDKYDYILIGTVSTAAISQITANLTRELGIEPHKIIGSGYMPFLAYGGIANVNSVDEVIAMLRCFGRSNASSARTINYITELLMADKEMRELLAPPIRRLYYDEATFRTKSVCAYILFKSDCADGELFRDYNNELLDNADRYPVLVYIMTFDVIAGVLLRRFDYCYERYYTDIRDIMDRCAERIYNNHYKDSLTRKENRVAICTSSLCGASYHLTGIIANIANNFKDRGYEVKVFVESKYCAGGEFFAFGVLGGGVNNELYEDDNRMLFDEGIEIIYNRGRTLIERLNNHLDNIINYSPELIMCFQLDCTCISAVLYNMFPILSVPTVGSLAVASHFHCVACPDREYLVELNKKYPWTDDEEGICEYRVAMIPAPPVVNPRSRSLYDWKDTDFIMVTVGNRLQYDLLPEFTDMVCGELKRDKDLKWVIVGAASNNYINERYEELISEKQIEFIQYESNLMELYELVDIYINPDRLGGGTTIAWAMLSGVPVLTNDIGSAGRSWIGKRNCTAGYDDMIIRIRRLKADSGYYCEQRMLIRSRALECNADNMCRQLENIMKRAEERFNAMHGRQGQNT